MREGSLPMRCSANWSTTVRTASECPSRLASPQPTTPASVSIRTNNHRGGTKKVSTLLILMDGAAFGDHGHDGLDNLLGGLCDVDSQTGFVILPFLEILQLRWQQGGRHVLMASGHDPFVDQTNVAAGEDGERRGSVLPEQVAVAAFEGRAGHHDTGSVGQGKALTDLVQPRQSLRVGKCVSGSHPLLVHPRVQAVAIDEGHAKTLGEQLADRALARALHAHDDDRRDGAR